MLSHSSSQYPAASGFDRPGRIPSRSCVDNAGCAPALMSKVVSKQDFGPHGFRWLTVKRITVSTNTF